MRGFFWILIFVLSLANSYEIKVISGFKHPRGIFVNEDRVLVSNIGEKTNSLVRDKGGFISKLDKNGNMIIERFIVGLDRPTSISQVNDTLFVLDIDRVRAFDMGSQEQIFDLFIGYGSDLNRIKKLNDNTLLIGDNANSIIYKIDLQTRTYEEFLKLDENKFGNMRDFTLDSVKNKLYIIAHSQDAKNTIVSTYDLNNKNIRILKEEKANYDSIVLYDNDALLGGLDENSSGRLYRLNLTNKRGEALKIENIKAPQDVFLEGGTLWVVIPTQAKVIRIVLKTNSPNLQMF